jgi:uncharacterized protein
MNKIKNDNKYINIVNHILENEEFNKIKYIEHHGISRYDHSLKVSYYSYKLAKLLKLDYVETARGGLLHDFFISDHDKDTVKRFVSTFNHPKKAVKNAVETFGVSDKELDIIKAHMFPINITLPKYAESWLVNLVDKAVGTMEFSQKFGYKFSYLANLYIVFLLNSIK